MHLPVNCLSFLLLCINTRVDPLDANTFYRNLSPRSVKIKYGSLRGIVVSLDSGNVTPPPEPGREVPQPLGPVEAFLGVPYATPPVGSLRFMPPVTPAHWRGTRVVSTPGAVCPQNPPSFPSVDTFNTVGGGSGANSASASHGNGHPNESFASPDFSSYEHLPRGRLEFVKRIAPFLRNQSEDCLYLNIFAPFSNGKRFVSIKTADAE